MVFDMSPEKAAPIISVSMPDNNFGNLLLEGKLVGYHDDRYGVTSGEHKIVMKLLQHDDFFVLFYLHIPYAYPIPDGVKETVRSVLETTLGQATPKIEFINCGTELERKNVQFKTELGG